MSTFSRIWDSVTGKGTFIQYPGFIDQAETIAGSPKANFLVTGATLTSSHKVDAWVDGRLQVDTIHFSKNLGTNNIEFTESIPIGKRVDIRVYLK